jgi:hypothetical protein
MFPLPIEIVGFVSTLRYSSDLTLRWMDYKHQDRRVEQKYL